MITLFLQLDVYFRNGGTGQVFRLNSYPQWRAAKYVVWQGKQWYRNRCRVRLKSRVLIHYQGNDLVLMAVALTNKVTERILPLYAFCFAALQQTALHYVRLPKMSFLSLSRWMSTRTPRWSCGGVFDGWEIFQCLQYKGMCFDLADSHRRRRCRQHLKFRGILSSFISMRLLSVASVKREDCLHAPEETGDECKRRHWVGNL